MKNVLFIVYYFPPMGGSGVQRPLKFVKYLREFGWNPIVMCPEPGMYPFFDECLQKELENISPDLVRVQPKTLFHIGKGLSKGVKQKEVPGCVANTARRILRLFMYPDNKKGWIKPAVEKGLELIREKEIDLIFSTAPPFSNHIAASQISERSGLPLILDYRDLWLNNHFMDGLFGWQKKIMRNMESSSLQKASAVVGLDDYMLKDISSSYSDIDVSFFKVPHGFDGQDFNNVDQKSTLNYIPGKLNILYSGLFYEQNQPDIFLESLVEADQKTSLNLSKIHLHFQGGLGPRIKKLIGDHGLEDYITDYGYISHDIAVANITKADVLWMISNFDTSHKQIKSGKLFEYFGSRKPIIGFVHQGEANKLLRDYGAGFIADLSKPENIPFLLEELFQKWETGSFPVPNESFIESFDRKKITKNLAQIFNEISTQ